MRWRGLRPSDGSRILNRARNSALQSDPHLDPLPYRERGNAEKEIRNDALLCSLHDDAAVGVQDRAGVVAALLAGEE